MSTDIILCVNGCGFYGNIHYKQLCSKCFKHKYPEFHKNEQKEELEELEEKHSVAGSLPAPDNPQPILKKRCCYGDCKRKIPIVLQYECKCGNMYCKYHKFMKDHDCTFNYQETQSEFIRKNNPTVRAKKIDFI